MLLYSHRGTVYVYVKFHVYVKLCLCKVGNDVLECRATGLSLITVLSRRREWQRTCWNDA